jgi:hypothetical protein
MMPTGCTIFELILYFPFHLFPHTAGPELNVSAGSPAR